MNDLKVGYPKSRRKEAAIIKKEKSKAKVDLIVERWKKTLQ